MVSNKTGGLFRLVVRLMQATSGFEVDLIPLANLLGMIYQVQDDYMNLTSQPMAAAKGYCDVLEEGKFSFPIIHAVENAPSRNIMLDMLRSRSKDDASKRAIVEYMTHTTKSIRYTENRIQATTPPQMNSTFFLPTNSLSPIPSEFTFTHDYSQSLHFSADAAFLETVLAIRLLAREDFEGQSPSLHFDATSSSNPSIDIDTRDHTTVTRKFMIWGLVLAYLWMEIPGRSMTSHYTFFWNGVEVCQILYFLPERLGVNDTEAGVATLKRDSNAKVHPHRSSALSLPALPPTTSPPPSANISLSTSRLQIATHFIGGQPIAKPDYQSAILFTLCEAAIPPVHNQIEYEWKPAFDFPDCRFSAHARRFVDGPRMEFYWVIEAVAYAANYLLDRGGGMWRGVGMMLRVDGRLIGRVEFVGGR
ncbi:MAG: hypothetical protein LQ350_008021 [Teloschistes chrysophthalmus]|nr:MAG: hypothetical protein LQ350_008021 [Niorma chrysophthalma]